jgi:hypothetical protein
MESPAHRNLIRALLIFGLCGVAAVVLSWSAAFDRPTDHGVLPTRNSVAAGQSEAQHWFANVKAFCNPVEVTTRMGWNPAPESQEGTMYEAACWALAGRMDEARRLILELPEGERWRGAGVVFDTGHPAADAGDETATGPLMELVVEFWPNHYMALYHAGAARFEKGDYVEAERYLTSFLEYYEPEDGWRRSATMMLKGIREG